MFTFLSIYLENKHAVIMKFKYTLISLILLLFIQCKAQTTEKSTLKNIENKEDFFTDKLSFDCINSNGGLQQRW